MCNKCGDTLVPGTNWYRSRIAKKDYICHPCELIRQRNKSNRTGVGSTHGEHHPELTRIRQERAEAYSLRDKVDAIKRDGFVYLITSALHPGHIKIGRSRDPISRLTSANTWCPWRIFDLLSYEFFGDCIQAENMIHTWLASRRVAGTEWFEVSTEDALAALRFIHKCISEEAA